MPILRSVRMCWQRHSGGILLKNYPKPLFGDWLTILAGLSLVVFLFATFWRFDSAAKIQIRVGNQVYGSYSLNQERDLAVKGVLGESHIHIHQGQVRFERSPCSNQYCVHQGWLNRAGQAAFCIPNQVSLELLGETKPYDSLNY